jgi:hypothetical protein
MGLVARKGMPMRTAKEIATDIVERERHLQLSLAWNAANKTVNELADMYEKVMQLRKVLAGLYREREAWINSEKENDT